MAPSASWGAWQAGYPWGDALGTPLAVRVSHRGRANYVFHDGRTAAYSPWETCSSHPSRSKRLLTTHLLALGHRRIAYADVTYHHDEGRHVSRADRMAGYRAAMAQAGLPASVFAPTTPVAVDRHVEVLREALATAQPTAVVCYGQMDALPTALAAAELGWSVPSRLSIAVVSEFPLLAGLAFTTAVNPFRALGARALELLRRRIAAPQRSLPSEPRKRISRQPQRHRDSQRPQRQHLADCPNP